jgi:hypothetical protein
VSKRNLNLVKQLDEAFARGNVEAVLEAIASDIEWREAEGMPYGTPPFHGPQEVAEKVLAPITADVDGFTATPERHLAAEEFVVTIGRYRGTGKQTDKALDIPFAHVWELRDGVCRGADLVVRRARRGEI